jgi:hypothetical protein
VVDVLPEQAVAELSDAGEAPCVAALIDLDRLRLQLLETTRVGHSSHHA